MLREQWAAEFKRELGKQANLEGDALDSAAEAEIENWLDDDEWMTASPRHAVAENLSYWDE